MYSLTHKWFIAGMMICAALLVAAFFVSSSARAEEISEATSSEEAYVETVSDEAQDPPAENTDASSEEVSEEIVETSAASAGDDASAAQDSENTDGADQESSEQNPETTTPEEVPLQEEATTEPVPTENTSESPLAEEVVSSPELSTDQAKYQVGDTVSIFGRFFSALERIVLTVFGGSEEEENYTEATQEVVTDEEGSFTATYVIDSILRPIYTIVASTLDGTELARTTFLDPVAVDFRQCANQDPALGDCHWIGSILNNNNSEYYEGMSVPQRTVFTGIGATTGNVHTLTFSHDATKGGVHAYDWLTSYGQADATDGDSPFTDLDGQACDDEIGPPGSLGATCDDLRASAHFIDINVPNDSFISKDGSTQARIDAYETAYGNRTVRIYGNAPFTAGSLALEHSVANGADTGDSEIEYLLSWTSASTQVLIEMAGHISMGDDEDGIGWGTRLGASSISGGPYHFNLHKLDGGSLGNQDNQIQGSEIKLPEEPETGHIVVDKVTDPSGDPQVFDFIASGGSYQNFSLSDADAPNDQELLAGAYAVSEDVPEGWDQTDVSCISSLGHTESAGSLNLDPTETITCTFENTKRGQITIEKVTVGGDDDFTFTGDVAGVLSNGEAETAEVVPGTYTSTESPLAGWDLTDLSCDDTDSSGDLGTGTATFEVDPGEHVTCTFENTKRGTLVVVKDAVPNDAQDFSFTGSGSIGGFLLDDDGNASNTLPKQRSFIVVPGTYEVSESPVAGWELASATCDQGETVDDIDVEPGETVTCTFVNQKLATIVLVKHTIGGDGTFDFDMTGDTLDPSAQLSTTGGWATTTFNDLDPDNTYSITEDVPTGWELTDASCSGTNSPEEITPNNGEVVTCVFENTKKGKIIIEKQTLPDGDPTTFDFSASWDSGENPDFGLIDGEQNDSGFLTPGNYSVSETLPPGWIQSDLTCESSLDDEEAAANLELDPGETITCVFENTKLGHIVVDKVTVPSGDEQSFEFTSDYGENFFLTDEDVPNDSGALVPGTYSVGEITPDGWEQTGALCDDDDSEDPDLLTLDPGETITCTFENTKQGKIIIEKQTLPDGDPTTFDFSASWDSGENPDFGLIDGEQNDSGFLTPGNYSVSETLPPGWIQSDLTCESSLDDEEAAANLELDPGETITCVFENTKIQDLVVEKTVNTSYIRTYRWTIDKSVTPDEWNLFTGDEGTSMYEVDVVKDEGTDSDYAATGTITITNPNTNASLAATIEDVSDVLDVSGAAVVDCGVEYPHELPAGESLVCTYVKSDASLEDELNTASVETSGLVPGGEGSANVIWGDPSELVNDSVTVEDTNGSEWAFSSSGTETYPGTFACDADEGEHVNTVTIIGDNDAELDADSATVTVNCYELEVTKDASTSFDRTYEWTIEKTSTTTELTLAPGQTYPVNYTVTVNADSGTDSNHAVTGTITVENPAPVAATINDVSDLVSDDIEASVECGETFPYTLAAGESLECSYSGALPNNSSRINTATAVRQNYSYDEEGESTEDGTTEVSGTADVDFAEAEINEIDECIAVEDTLEGVLDEELCVNDELPAEYSYTYTVGPYEADACGTTRQIDNTASFVTNDTGVTGEDSWSIPVEVACVCSLTQGYWKTHNEEFKGGAPADDNWGSLGLLKELTGFFTTEDSYPVVGPNISGTWFDVFWTAPKGNVYYNLAHQYQAAKLNVLNGAYAPAQVADAIAQAEGLFVAKTPQEIAALKNKPADKALKQQFITLAGILGAFNEGLTNPAGHCSEVPL